MSYSVKKKGLKSHAEFEAPAALLASRGQHVTQVFMSCGASACLSGLVCCILHHPLPPPKKIQKQPKKQDIKRKLPNYSGLKGSVTTTQKSHRSA